MSDEARAIGRAIHDALDDQYGGDLDIYLTSPNGPTADEVIEMFAECAAVALRANPEAALEMAGAVRVDWLRCMVEPLDDGQCVHFGHHDKHDGRCPDHEEQNPPRPCYPVWVRVEADG